VYEKQSCIKTISTIVARNIDNMIRHFFRKINTKIHEQNNTCRPQGHSMASNVMLGGTHNRYNQAFLVRAYIY
jgi:hypothetical protein